MQPDNNTPMWEPMPPEPQPGSATITQPAKPCPPDKLNQLSQRQLTEINKGLAAIDAAIRECDLAEKCGVNCEDRRSIMDSVRQELMSYKQHYFPGRR